MKIAALYDIHGNLPALNALLEELKEVQPDLIVVGGDIVSGPMPGQTLERLFQLGDQVRSIRGNGDREVVMAFDGQPLNPAMPEEVREVTHWVAGQLTRSQRDFLAVLPEQLVLQVEGLGIHFRFSISSSHKSHSFSFRILSKSRAMYDTAVIVC